MKKRIICFVLAAVLCAAALLPGLTGTTAAYTEPEAQTGAVDEDLIARIEFTTAPVFSLSGGASLSAGYDLVSYYDGSCSYLYDQTGKAVSATQFQIAGAISDRLLWAKPVGTDKYALYLDRKPLTNAVYTSFEVQCGCVIAKRDGGRDFFDLDGNRRTVGTLPSGYEARYVTPAGTVVARIRNTAISSSTGDLLYNYVLLDRNGQILMSADLVGRNEVEQITAVGLENELLSHGALYDCYGHLICRAYCLTLNENRYIGTGLNSETGKYAFGLCDRAGNLVAELDADRVEFACGEVFVFTKSGRCGIADQNGTVLVPATYSSYCQRAQLMCYQEPALRRIVLRSGDSFSIFDDHGNMVKTLNGYASVELFYDSFTAGKNNGSRDVYDLDGNLLKEYQSSDEIKYVNGVRFMKIRNSESWYAIDLAGNRLSEMNFSKVGDNNVSSLFGIATVYQNGWYFINAAGELLNAEKMDRAPTFNMEFQIYHSKPEKLLGVYVQNGKAGICRYVPPLGSCEITADGKHDWKVSRVITPATCVEGGYAEYRCAACGRTKSADLPIDPDSHAWALTEVLTEGETLHDSTGLYTCTRCNETKEAPLCAREVFTDMPKKSHWAHDAIDWAYFSGLTGGTGDGTTFSPDKIVTRGEVVTFLYTMKGKPEVSGTNPFSDVKKKDFYYNAVLWAVENGVTGGTTETSFSPKKTCTRAEIVMFLWAAAGRPEPESTENRFEDVKKKDYYYKAVLWAVENGVTGGVDETHFGPKADCTRAQVMTFLRAAAPILPPD